MKAFRHESYHTYQHTLKSVAHCRVNVTIFFWVNFFCLNHAMSHISKNCVMRIMSRMRVMSHDTNAFHITHECHDSSHVP